MFNGVFKLFALILAGGFFVWLTLKVGTGLNCWGPFVACMAGLIVGLTYAAAKAAVHKRRKK